MDIQADSQTDRQACRQTGRQVNRHYYSYYYSHYLAILTSLLYWRGKDRPVNTHKSTGGAAVLIQVHQMSREPHLVDALQLHPPAVGVAEHGPGLAQRLLQRLALFGEHLPTDLPEEGLRQDHVGLQALEELLQETQQIVEM